MKKILFTASTLTDEDVSSLREEGYEIINGKFNYTEEELIEATKDIDGYILGGDEYVSENVLKAAKNIKSIVFFGTGYETYIDVKAASKLGVAVSNTPRANAYTVAEYTLAMMLDMVKRISVNDRKINSERWDDSVWMTLKNKTIGIVGMGAIGTNLARMLKNVFNSKIVYSGEYRNRLVEEELGIEKVPLDELFKMSDIISINTNLTNEKKYMVGSAHFSMAKENLILINTARANLVDPFALKEALLNNLIRCAAFDGYFSEPILNIEEDKWGLLSLPNDKFMVTTHRAYKSDEAIDNMERMAIDEVKRALNEEILKYKVN